MKRKPCVQLTALSYLWTGKQDTTCRAGKYLHLIDEKTDDQGEKVVCTVPHKLIMVSLTRIRPSGVGITQSGF